MAIETLGAALRQINRLFADGVVTGLSDAQLLDRFLAERDAAAFEMLVARHGPMVLSVCRGVLRNPDDAEDAFQATFLVLVKKAARSGAAPTWGAGCTRSRTASRSRPMPPRPGDAVQEREAGQMAAATSTSGPVIPDELLPALHEEIARLPEKYRLPIVLCDLEGMPQVQAAGTAALERADAPPPAGRGARAAQGPAGPPRTGARTRHARGGVPPRGAGSPCPRPGARRPSEPRWPPLNHAVAAGAVSAAAQSLTQEVLKIMLVQKLTGLGRPAGGRPDGLGGVGRPDLARGRARESRQRRPPFVRRPARSPARSPKPDPLDAVGTFPVRGRVLDPDGKPVAGAEIFIRHYAELGWPPDRPGPPQGQKGRVAVSDADGRFHFELDKASSDWPYGDEPAWHKAQIAAVAPGFGAGLGRGRIAAQGG